MQTPGTTDDTSWWDDLVAGLSRKQAPPPPAPPPPPVDQSAWDKSVEQAKVSDSLGTVHDVGLTIFGETKSYSDRSDANEPIDAAGEKMAWTIMNGGRKWGFDRQSRASTASPIKPSAQALNDPAVRAAYQSSMKAAREAYLGWPDPTNGAKQRLGTYFSTTIFLADSMHPNCISPRRSDANGQISKSAKMR
jgi:hypothetical protein